MPTKRPSAAAKRPTASASRRAASRQKQEAVEGLMLAIGPVVHVISREDLATFRLPDAVAKAALAALAKKPLKMGGKTPTPVVAGVRVSASGTSFSISSVLQHGLTPSRVC